MLKYRVQDGLQLDMLVNFIIKYGVVPKSLYGESYNTKNTRRLNWILTYKLREATRKIRENKQFNKDIFMNEIYTLLCHFYGKPPTPSTLFTWRYENKDNDIKTIEQLTPLTFYKDIVKINLNDYICVVHDPRNTYYKTYSVENLGNVIGGKDVLYVNLPIDKFKILTKKSIDEQKAVWFGCDVG